MGVGILETPTFLSCDGVRYSITSEAYKYNPASGLYVRGVYGRSPDRYHIRGVGFVGVAGTAGCTIPAAVEPPKPPTFVDGPRLGSLSVSSSAYGNPRPIGFGTFPMEANIIWSPGLTEKSIVSVSQGQGSSSGEQTYTTNYSYYVSFAAAFGEGPCSDVLRIWANGVLIFDKTTTDNVTRKPGLKFRLYKGDSTQLPDQIIVDSEGVENTPAFRGTVYIVFEDLPLSDFNNALPEIKAEISFNTTQNRPQQLSGTAIPTTLTSQSSKVVAVDWDRGYSYYTSIFGIPNNGMFRVNMSSNLVDREMLYSEALDQSTTQGLTRFAGDGSVSVMPDGSLVASVFSTTPFASNSAPIIRLDGTTLKETARYGSGGANIDMDSSSFAYCQVITHTSVFNGTGKTSYAICGTTLFNSVGVLSLPDLNYVWDSDTSLVGGLGGAKLLAVVGGEPGEVWVLCGANYNAISSSDLLLYKMTIGPSGDVAFSLYDTIPVTRLMFGETALDQAGPMAYDVKNKSLLIFASENTSAAQRVVKYNIATKLVAWATEDLNIRPQNHHWENSRLLDDTFGFIVGSNGVQINTDTGDTFFNNVAPDWANGEGGLGAGSYDSRTETFVGVTNSGVGGPFIRFFFNRNSGNGEGFDTIVSDLCSRVGITTASLDVVDVAPITVPGYVITDRSTARQAVEVLTDLYLVDAFESDFKLKFKQRGSASVRDLTEAQLGPVDGDVGKVIKEIRRQEIEMPERFTLQYRDSTNDYVQSAHSTKRVSEPDQSMYSHNQLHTAVNVALTPDTAKQQSEKILYSTWRSRAEYSINMSWEHLDLDPSDVINLTLDNGSSYHMRVSDFDVGADLTVAMGSVSDTAAQYVSTATGDAGLGVHNQVVSGPAFIKTFLVDMPLVKDGDETVGRTTNPLYFYMGGFSDNSFARGTLYGTDDNISFDAIGSEVVGMAWGTIAGSLSDPLDGNPFITDTASSFTVTMNAGVGELNSITREQFLLDTNVAAVLKNNGEVEIINFQNVIDNGGGTFTLSTFLRGRRGTDTMSFGHEEGEVFILLRGDFGGKFLSALANRGVSKDYKGVGSKQFFEQGEDITLTSDHRALKPYHPAQITAVEDLSNNIDFGWERRTRVGGDWLDATATVPLNEDAELYEIDIFTGGGRGAVVLRTITGITTNMYEYLNADIVSDFGDVPPQVSIELYQVSGQVGRGFSRRTTIGIPDVTLDPEWANVVLLCAFDGVDASTTTIDDSLSDHNVAMNAGAQLDTTQKKFGVSSAVMDGVNNTVHVTDGADFAFGAGQFTVEGQFRWTSIQDIFNGLIGQWDASIASRQWLLWWDVTAGSLGFATSPNGASSTLSATGAWTPTVGVWYHLAADRDSSDVVRIYADGVMIGKGTDATNIATVGTPDVTIGYYGNARHIDGHIDEVRVTKGVARYASDAGFAPPTVAFPRS